MGNESEHQRNISQIRLGIEDPEFQRKWKDARDLSWDIVETAFAHGFEGAGRFAERTFDEVSDYLRESWDGMRPGAEWDDVRDIVRSGYERADGGVEMSQSADLEPEALEHFGDRTTGGSVKGGVMGEQAQLGASERASEFEGEGGTPVERGRRVREDEPEG